MHQAGCPSRVSRSPDSCKGPVRGRRWEGFTLQTVSSALYLTPLELKTCTVPNSASTSGWQCWGFSRMNCKTCVFHLLKWTEDFAADSPAVHISDTRTKYVNRPPSNGFSADLNPLQLTGQEAVGWNTVHQEILHCEVTEHGQRLPREVVEPLWRHSEATWMWSWAIGSRWPYLSTGLG